MNIIGNGVALNIPILFREISEIEKRGVPAPNLMISDRCQVVMPYHILFDQYEEERLGGKSFGSTKSGIAPFYSDKYAKIGWQVNELFQDDDVLREKIERVCVQKNVLLQYLYGKDPIDPEELLETIHQYRDMVEPYVGNVSVYLDQALKENKTILLEGQLGTMKDPDHGIYPMVTSSSTLAAYGAIGAGLPPYAISQIVVVNKAYSSAVGAGEFTSEIFGAEADELRRRGGDGGEYGATTGRPRRGTEPPPAVPEEWAGMTAWLPDMAAGCRAARMSLSPSWMSWDIWTRSRSVLPMRSMAKKRQNSLLPMSWPRQSLCIPCCPDGNVISAASASMKTCRRTAGITLNSLRNGSASRLPWSPMVPAAMILFTESPGSTPEAGCFR